MLDPDNLKRLLSENRISVTRLAVVAKMPSSTISGLIHGYVKAGPKTFVRICNALNQLKVPESAISDLKTTR